MKDADSLFNEEATLLRLTEQQQNPLSALQAEVARMSGFINEAFRNHEKQIDENKRAVEAVATIAKDTQADVGTLKEKVNHIESRLDRGHTTWLLVLSPVVSLLGLLITTYFALTHH